MSFNFIDLFSGCGGLSEGFLETNQYNGLAHVEWAIPMVNTLRYRLENKWGYSKEEALKHVVHFDMQKSDELINGNWNKDSQKLFAKSNDESIALSGLNGIIQKQNVDVIVGGPPCQAYSIAGRAQDKNSMQNDYRNYLFESFVNVVEAFKPKIFVFENVPGILSANPGGISVLQRIYDAFAEIGYEIRNPKDQKKSKFSASSFGVPQNRDRIIIIGVKNDSNIKLESIYEQIEKLKSKKKITVRDAIGHLPQLLPLQEPIRLNGRNISHNSINKNDENIHHKSRYHNLRDIEIFKKWISNNLNKASSIDKISFYNNNLSRSSKHAKYRNLDWELPSPTIVAHLQKDGLMFIHPDELQARSITVKEASLLQSFPEDYKFIGSLGDQYKMIGNAVPPLMAKNIALAISSVLTKFK